MIKLKYAPDSFRTAFVGSSTVALWGGNYMAPNMFFDHVKQDFASTFPEQYKPIALGGLGDSAANVLFRLKFGILKQQEFDPQVFWLILGTDDLTKWGCSEEVVVMGILRVVEELLQARPQAKIVINSLLPMSHTRDSKTSVALDFEEMFGKKGQKGKDKWKP